MKEQTAALTSRRLTFLDGLRGLAAIYVVIYHCRLLLYEGFNAPLQFAALPVIAKVPAYVLLFFAFGRQAVLFFFVLSGFVIHLRYAEQLKRDGSNTTFDFKPFWRRRIRRLLPPLAFALLLTTALDTFGRVQNYPIYFGNTQYPAINELVQDFDYNPATGALKVVFGSGLETWGSNQPLWSLRLEWWFYVAYPLFWLLSRRSLGLAAGVAAVMFVVSLFGGTWFFPLLQRFMGAFISWWLGALLAEAYVGRAPFKLRHLVPFVLLLLGLIPGVLAGWTSMLPISVHDFLWALAFMGMLAACFIFQEARGNLVILERFKPLGDFSYTLYVCHAPIVVLLSGWLLASRCIIAKNACVDCARNVFIDCGCLCCSLLRRATFYQPQSCF
jgi:peptidoglycan/LPS O-acetylase OafA/YrhL